VSLKIEFLVSLLVYLTIATLTAYRVSASPAEVAVDPLTSNVNAMTTFTVNVTVFYVANFTAYQFSLYYLNSILHCITAGEGPFLTGGGSTYFGKDINDNYNSTHGRLSVYATLLGNTSVEGSGVIATITFQATAGGNTTLHLADIELDDEKIPPHPIPYTSVDGSVQSTGPAPIHDVAITQLTSPKTIIFQSFTGNVTVTLTNNGNYWENATVTFYANVTAIPNATVIGTITNVSLLLYSSGSISLTQAWNTTGFSKGNYTISAYVLPVPGETNTANNNFTDGWIMVTMVGDVTGGTPNPWDFVPDGKCDGKDIGVVARCYGSKPGSVPPEIWYANCDVNNDGKCDGKDIAIVARHYGEKDP
jgi:hypothetical protein